MIDGFGALSRDVLNERATQRHVHHLNAPADRQGRDTQLDCRSGERELVGIARGVCFASRGMRRFAEQARIDVFAAREDEPRDVVEGADCERRIDRRQDDGN